MAAQLAAVKGGISLKMDIHSILIDVGMIVFAVLLIIVVVRILAKPIKALLKFLIHAAAGLLLLFIVNYVGNRFFGFSLEPTNLRIVIAAIAGVPGVILMVLYQLLF